jgi:molybdopterin/thiamine biosynthesis adenylyltransferase
MPGGGIVGKPLKILVPDTFPFGTPVVALPTTPAMLTWHLSPHGTLCLFRPSDNPDRPWETVDGLFDRIAYFYDQRAQGWPNDPGDPDLQRYFDTHPDFLVTYDGSDRPIGHLVRTSPAKNWEHLAAGQENRKTRRREAGKWWYGVDVGELDDPIWDWSTLLKAMNDEDRVEVEALAAGGTGILLVHYARNGTEGRRDAAIALLVVPPKKVKAKPQGRYTPKAKLPKNSKPSVFALEMADDSLDARRYRAGPEVQMLQGKHVAVIGCGSVGSFTVDLLARSGVGQFTLVDPERLIPGNCVRHLADRSHVPKKKADAVRDIIETSGFVEPGTTRTVDKHLNADLAAELLMNTDLVIDATANATVTGTLRSIASTIGRVNFIKVGLHREGGLVRVDRFGEGTTPDDQRPPFIDALPGTGPTYRENGCGDPVSTTPPASVLKAAATATEFAVDTLHPKNQRHLPDAQVDVLVAQPDDPWTTTGPWT